MQLLRQELFDDRFPLFFERGLRDGATGAAIPVRRVPEVAFLAVEIGVNPGAGFSVDVLRDAMRRVPVATRVVPERDKEGRESGRRVRELERVTKFREGHRGDDSGGGDP